MKEESNQEENPAEPPQDKDARIRRDKYIEQMMLEKKDEIAKKEEQHRLMVELKSSPDVLQLQVIERVMVSDLKCSTASVCMLAGMFVLNLCAHPATRGACARETRPGEQNSAPRSTSGRPSNCTLCMWHME